MMKKFIFLGLFLVVNAFGMDNGQESLPEYVFEEDGVVHVGGMLQSGCQVFKIYISKDFDSKEDNFLIDEELKISVYSAVKELYDLDVEKELMTNFLKKQIDDYIAIKKKNSLSKKLEKESESKKDGLEEEKK